MLAARAANAFRVATGRPFLMARSRPFLLRSGTALQTPLLVPSITSKGFLLRQDGISEAGTYLEVASNHLTEALLISAYDLHHGLLPQAAELFTPDHWSTLYATPSLLVIDSGGYELGDWWEDSDLVRERHQARPFAARNYQDLIRQLPEDRDLLVVNYDHIEGGDQRPGYDRQIAESAASFALRPDLMSDFLLKPPFPDTKVSARGLADQAQQLSPFDVIGVTDRELGQTLLDRLVAIAELRQLLDACGIDAPLHIFGVLDPLLVTLFYFAGAEIFDGLTWLRYGSHQSTSINRATIALLDDCLDQPDAVVGARAQIGYLATLTALKRTLRRWTDSGEDFSVFPHLGPELERAYAMFKTQLQRRDN